MKKTLLAAALLSIVGSACAQSSVTVYGIVDMSIANENDGNPAGATTRLDSGVQSGSRLGFKGKEDLGGGLAANFVLESGISADTGGSAQGGLTFGRQSWVGLSGGFGAVKLGRQKTVSYEALDNIDPFHIGMAGDVSRLISTSGNRVNNALTYVTPDMSGFSAQATYGFGEIAGDTSANRQTSFALNYASGPLLAVLTYVDQNNATGSDGAKTTILGGVYDFGGAKAHFAYAINKGTSTLDTRDMMVGVTVPFGVSNFLASYIRKSDKFAANADAQQFALGYTYALSKRTNFYTSFSRTANDSTVSYNAAAPGATDRLIDVGIRHFF